MPRHTENPQVIGYHQYLILQAHYQKVVLALGLPQNIAMMTQNGASHNHQTIMALSAAGKNSKLLF